MKKRDGAPAGRGWRELLGHQVVQLVDALADPGGRPQGLLELSYQASFFYLFVIFSITSNFGQRRQRRHSMFLLLLRRPPAELLI